MKNIRKTLGILAIGMTALCAQPAYAIKANPKAVAVRQPDGTTLMVRMHGDENHHYMATLDGYRIAPDSKGYYCYVKYDSNNNKMSLTPIRAHNVSERNASEVAQVSMMKKANAIEAEWRQNNKITPKEIGRTLAPSVINPKNPTGRAKAEANESQYLCVLVNFADCKMKFKNQDFDNFLNQKGYDGYGSVKDYFRDNSGGKFVPNFKTVGPYTLPLPQSSYANNDYETGSDIDPRQMVQDAIKLVREKHPDLNFKQFDNDGDGYMDNIYIIYAGYSEASTGNAADMWPHSWTLGNDTLLVDGIWIKNYSCSQELVGSPETSTKPSMDGIGTFTHEFGHVLGLKDLYDTNDFYDGMGIDPGAYSLYASGSYNNDSKTPAGLWAFERLQMGWITQGKEIKEIKDAEDVTQKSSTSTFTARYIDCQPGRKEGTGYEWFILENRQLTGWDEFIPGHGLLIYHYDYTDAMVRDYWKFNSPNNNSRHRCLYIKPADGIDDDNSRSGDTYPGKSANTSFTDFTTPNALNWNGDKTNVPVTNIVERDGVIYYQVSGGATKWNVINTLSPLRILENKVDVAATVANKNSAVTEVGFCWKEGMSEPTISDSHKAAKLSDTPTLSITDLKPGTIYTYKAYMKMEDGTIVYGSPLNIKTEYATAIAPFKCDFTQWSQGTVDGWEIVDNNSDGTTWVYDKISKAICYQFDYWNNADDWLLSKRRFHVPENGCLYFKRGVNEQQYIEGIEVYVSTTTSDLKDFYLHKQFSIADNFGMEVYEEVDLSMYAGQDIYIALRCNSERSQGLIRIWDVRLEQKLGTPDITYFGKGDNDDQIKIEWSPIENAAKYYLYLGRVSSKPYQNTIFTSMDYYEGINGDVELGTGRIFFKGSGAVTLKTINEGYEDLKFMLYPSGPIGTSYLDIQGTTDGKSWEPVCPRVAIDSYDSEGIECNYVDFVKEHGYISLRFIFHNNGRLANIRYLTVGYNDGYVWEQLAAGSVKEPFMKVNAMVPNEFLTGSYVSWVAAGTEDNIFFDESADSFYNPENAATAPEDATAIQTVPQGIANMDEIYDINGTRRSTILPGINIVRKADGTIVKVYK